jgi:hypothetical protein
MNAINISIKEIENKIIICFKNKKFSLEYPKNVWSDLPTDIKSFFLDNYLFLKSVHLPFMLNVNKINLNTNSPLLKTFFLSMQFFDIPSLSDLYEVKSIDFFKKFFNTEFKFKDYKIKTIKKEFPTKENEAVLSLSMGKDSLLTFAVSRELGIKTHSVMIQEKGAPIENAHKRGMIKKFNKEFNLNVERVYNETMILHSFKYFKIPSKENYILSHLMTEYAFILIPFLYKYNAKYLFFGNEQNCDMTYQSKEGYRCYPVFDQSTEWMIELTNMFSLGLKNKFHVHSLLEPLNDLAITGILHNRYPEIAKYQYSCFPDETLKINKNTKWCSHCSKCARIFIILKALGIDTNNLGFKENMLKKEYMPYYSIFGVVDGGSPFDSSGAGRDEQLFAFYLATQNGIKGDLIEEFKKRFLDEAKEREDEFYKRFFKVYDPINVPLEIKKQLLSIYNEELSKMQI